MVEVGKNARLKVKWTVSPYDYSPDKVREITSKFSKKYGVPREKVKVEPVFKLVDQSGDEVSVADDVITNIQNPEFQVKLFKEYLDVNNVEDYDFEQIKSINAEIDSKIDYDVYDKFRRYSIKWIRWSNFLSYGPDNEFDFTKLKGLILLNGEPANQSGKTTFAIDLVHFLLFGKTSKASTLDKIFNRHLPKETEAYVEGCIEIDGVDYVIKRTLNRPQLTKRTERSKTTQKVEYYKIVGGEMEELCEYAENQNEENGIQTNKAIKEAIGKEADFDLIMSVTEDNLDDLVKQKDTERGKMLSRWIGLLPIEQKDVIARQKYNSEIKPYLLSNRYDVATMENEIKAFALEIEKMNKYSQELGEKNKEIDGIISALEESRDALMKSIQTVDETLLKVDIATLQRKIDDSIDSGKKKNAEVSEINEQLASIGDVEFSIDKFNDLNSKLSECKSKRAILGERYNSLKRTIEQLKKSEFCPTCGRKLDNVDNTEKIGQLQNEMAASIEEGKKVRDKENELQKLIDEQNVLHEKYQLRSKLTVKKSALEVNISNLRSEYVELRDTKKEYEKNKAAIDANNEINVKLSNISAKLTSYRGTKESNVSEISKSNGAVAQYNKEISDREKMIEKLEEEKKLIRNWKIYLDLVGKNGISKMVLRRTLPIINANLSRILSDVCDFDIEISVTDKNDVVFQLVRDGVKAELSSGSGFEKTAAALALRSVLASISTLPRSNCLIFDEILGRVAKENYENMHNLYDKILAEYDFILQISHLDDIKDWHNTTITVCKSDNVSKIKVSKRE